MDRESCKIFIRVTFLLMRTTTSLLAMAIRYRIIDEESLKMRKKNDFTVVTVLVIPDSEQNYHLQQDKSESSNLNEIIKF